MTYQPTEEEAKLLKEAIERRYPELSSKGVRYFIRYSNDRGTIYADVNWGNVSSLYELTAQNGRKQWYMKRDWND